MRRSSLLAMGVPSIESWSYSASVSILGVVTDLPEIMTSGWCGDWVGWLSGCSRFKARAACSGSPEKLLARGGVPICGGVRGTRPPRLRRLQRRGVAVDSGRCSQHVPRDAARDAPDLMCHRPKTPIGRRGVSLTYIADYPRGANASPARRFTLSHPPGSLAAGCIGVSGATRD